MFYKYIKAIWKILILQLLEQKYSVTLEKFITYLPMKALTLHCRLSLLKPSWHRSHLQSQEKPQDFSHRGSPSHMTAFSSPRPLPAAKLSLHPDVQCDILWPLYMEAGLSQDAWLLLWLHITTCRRENSIRKAIHAVATYFNTEAEKHRNLWPENSFAGQRALSTEHSLALPACVPPGLPRITTVHKTNIFQEFHSLFRLFNENSIHRQGCHYRLHVSWNVTV